MPPFVPGEAKTAIAPIVAKPSSMDCEAELFLGPDPNTKAVTSGRVPFVSTGAAKNVSLPINMPSSPGSYHGYIDVFAGGFRFLAYILKEDVVIVAPAPTPNIRVLYISWYSTSFNLIAKQESIKIWMWCKNYSTFEGTKRIVLRITGPGGIEEFPFDITLPAGSPEDAIPPVADRGFFLIYYPQLPGVYKVDADGVTQYEKSPGIREAIFTVWPNAPTYPDWAYIFRGGVNVYRTGTTPNYTYRAEYWVEGDPRLPEFNVVILETDSEGAINQRWDLKGPTSGTISVSCGCPIRMYANPDPTMDCMAGWSEDWPKFGFWKLVGQGSYPC